MIQHIGVALVLRPPQERQLTDDDRRYGTAFHQKSLELGGQIMRGELRSFDALWGHCRDWRVQQLDVPATSTHHAESPDPSKQARARESFATSRMSRPGLDHKTPIGRRYRSILPKIVDSPDAKEIARSDGKALRLTQWFRLNQRPIPLTKLVVHLNDAGNKVESRRIPGLDKSSNGYMQHTNGKYVAPLMEHVDELYRRLRSPGITTAEQQRDTLARMHWVLAHAMPDERGSAAKSELAIRSIALSLGIDLPPFKPDIGPDLEAFVTPLPDFIEKYRGDYFVAPEAD